MNYLIFILLTLFSLPSNAVWLNTTGKVSNIVTYGGTETVLVNLSAKGTAVPECSNTSTFAISRSISPEQRARMFAILLAAKSSDRHVTVSYSDVGSCEPWDSNTNAYRKITRLYLIN